MCVRLNEPNEAADLSHLNLYTFEEFEVLVHVEFQWWLLSLSSVLSTLPYFVFHLIVILSNLFALMKYFAQSSQWMHPL